MMSRITQIIQNIFIRLEGFFSVFFGSFFGFLGKQLTALVKILGISTTSDYIIESSESDESKQTKPESTQPTPTPTKIPEPSATTTRRPRGKMDDYFLDMAKQVKK